MFTAAKLKLTMWYLAIIMLVSLFLSLLIYRGVDSITNRALVGQKSRMERRLLHQQQPNTPKPVFEAETLVEIRKNLIYSLVRINILIFFVSGISGYFLAGRTLKPIEEMVDDQKKFISDASHELKTPLTALKTELEVTLRGKKHDKKDLLKILRSNLEEVNKLQKLAENLLKDSRYQKGSYLTPHQEIKLDTVVESSVKSLSGNAKRKNITLEQKLKKVTVKGHRASLDELVSILVDNAIKFSKKDSKVIVRTKKDKNIAILQVIDKGTGIRKADQPHIFNRFYQADSSRSKIKNDGFGLGLSIAKKIVKIHNGTIIVKSEFGKGSTFTVKLPLG